MTFKIPSIRDYFSPKPSPSPAAATFKVRYQNREVTTTVIHDASLLNAFLSTLSGGIVSLDIQYSYTNIPAWRKPSLRAQKVAVLKLSSGRVCLLVHLISFRRIPTELALFLDRPDLTFCGVTIHRSLAALKRDYALECRNVVDLGRLVADVWGYPFSSTVGLVAMANAAGLLTDVVDVTGKPSAEEVESAASNGLLAIRIANYFLRGTDVDED